MRDPLNSNGTINPPLKGPLLRLERANEHIREIEPIVDAVTNSGTLIEELHPDGVHKTIKLRLANRLPDRALILVGDACNSLRSALDQLAVALAKKSNIANTREIYFPIAASLEDFENCLRKGEMSKMNSDIMEVIRSFKPYKGPNSTLWSLNKLRVKDFHNDLIGVSASSLQVISPRDLPAPNWRPSDSSLNIRPNVSFGGFPWDAVNNGMDVAIVGKDADIKDKIGVSVEVVFREPETINGLEVSKTLGSFSRSVERVLVTFRDRFFA